MGRQGSLLSRVTARAAGIFRREDRRVIVEVDSDRVKVVETLSSKGGRAISLIAQMPLPSREIAGLSDILKKIFDERRIPARTAVFVVPRHYLTMRLIRVPSTDDREIGGMIEMESLKHVPYQGEGTVVGSKIIEKQSDGYSRVQFVMAQEQVVGRLAAAATPAGITVSRIAVGPEALAAWFLRACPDHLAGQTLVVNVDMQCLEIVIFDDARLVFSRGVSYARRPMTREAMLDQIKLSVAAYPKESAKTVEKVVVTGVAGQAGPLGDQLAPALGVPVEVVEQARGIPLDERCAADLAGASFAGLLGLALARDSSAIDLSPEAARDAYRITLLKKDLVTAVSLVLCACLLAVALVVKITHDKTAVLASLNAELATLEPKVGKAKKMAEAMSALTEAVSERPRSADVLAEICRVTPDGTLLNMLDYESGTALIVRGEAPLLDGVIAFNAALEKSPYFENCKIRRAAKRMVSGNESVDFELGATISKVK